MNEHDDEMLYFDFYDSDWETLWCWKKEIYSSQEFKSEDAAPVKRGKGATGLAADGWRASGICLTTDCLSEICSGCLGAVPTTSLVEFFPPGGLHTKSIL